MSSKTMILVAMSLATLMISTDAVRVPHSARLHRRLTFVAQPTPEGWRTNSLEDYQHYHFRYLALGCHNRKGDDDEFFEKCCHPRTRKAPLENVPVECTLDPESMVKALYIIKASSSHVNQTNGENGNPVFIPNGTIQSLAPEQGCNQTVNLSPTQIDLLTEMQQQLSNYSNSSYFANITDQIISNSSIIDFANLTTLLNSNYTSFGNLSQLLLANLTQFSNISSCQVFLSNQTLNSSSVFVVPTESQSLKITQLKQDNVVQGTNQSDKKTIAHAPIAEAFPDAAKSSAEAKAIADAKATEDAKAAAAAQAATDAKAAAEAQAAAAQSAAAAQATAAAQAAAAAQATAAAQAAADAQATAAAKAAADAQASAAANVVVAAPAPTESYAAPSVGNALAGLSNIFGTNGDAHGTFFFQDGAYGACGVKNADSTPLVALPPALYANGAHCGKNVRILNTANGKSVTAAVQDMCPGCPSASSLDLSTGAFDAIGARATGVLPIEWAFVN